MQNPNALTNNSILRSANHCGAVKLYRFGARDYDPTIQRFTTKDPLGFAGGDTNLYSYAGNNPMSAVDRTGLDPGDKFGNIDDAVKDAFKYILRTYPDKDSVEYGGRIVKKDGKFTYNSIIKGNGKEIEMDYNWCGFGSDKAEFHTHLPNSNHDMGNSSGDEFHAMFTRIPSYVLSPFRDRIDVYTPPPLFGTGPDNRSIPFAN
ncbi:MAG: RHS repeat-associated core domain-containing protein [Pseudobdellovibrio sp.]